MICSQNEKLCFLQNIKFNFKSRQGINIIGNIEHFLAIPNHIDHVVRSWNIFYSLFFVLKKFLLLIFDIFFHKLFMCQNNGQVCKQSNCRCTIYQSKSLVLGTLNLQIFLGNSSKSVHLLTVGVVETFREKCAKIIYLTFWQNQWQTMKYK